MFPYLPAVRQRETRSRVSEEVKSERIIMSPKKAIMISDTDRDDEPQDRLSIFDRHLEKCSQNHVPEWLKSVTEALALESSRKMAKHALDSDDDG